MRLAFYAPLKSPLHPVPSGDRRVGEGLLQALRLAGHDVSIASHLRSFDRHGDASRQIRVGHVATRLADRLAARYRRSEAPQAWFTYHVHHKAPDWLGPRVSAALDIPYIVAEASVAPKQRDGPWKVGYDQALHAVQMADAVVFLNPVDVPQVMRARGGRGIAVHLPPFIDVWALRAEHGHDRHDLVPDRVRFITVAMMRDGAKLDSYRVLAAALTRLPATGWELEIVGDGPARAQVQALFAAFAPAQVRMTGELPPERVPAEMHQADVFVWPAVDEAFGMVFLEAQACGLPVVAGDSGGVRGVVDDGRSGWLVPAGDAGAFARAMHRLLVDRDRRAAMGTAARRYVEEHHDLRTAARTLDALVAAVVAQHGSVAPDPKVSASC